MRVGEGADLEAGTVVGVKLRSVQSGRKLCEPGTRLSWPAMPSLYRHEAGDPTTVYVCEGESDAAWLLGQWKPGSAVYCLHGGAALWDARWAGRSSHRCPDPGRHRQRPDPPTDTRGIQNIGDHLAQRIMADVPGSKRLRPPMPARDWCEATT